MKKGKITMIIIMAIACFALATIMSMQFKIVRQTDITSIETMREEELRAELADLRELYTDAEEQYQDKADKLNEYREQQQSEEESEKIVEKELENVNMYLGKTDVEGEGIVITIKDIDENIKEFEGIKPISDEDLLVIVDYLKLAGAEAISINDQRIINMTDMAYVGQTLIYINQQRILGPYVIKAIGNSTDLESTLLGKGGYIDELRKFGFEVDIVKKNDIKIPKYNKELKYKYME